ncbi:MAG TPA: AmmeMemoRadiSam system protein B [Steroidobacteraceae bacterium]
MAGMFYPDSPAVLGAQVRSYLKQVACRAQPAERPKALIVPHAGYVYSGPIAAAAYARLAGACADIRRVVLLGPAHRVMLRGLAVPSADSFATPLGEIEVDRAAVSSALELPQVSESDRAHALEHSLEVQLPFLQTLLSNFRLVPFAVGDTTAAQVAEVIELLWGGAETLIVISSDLSHYHAYREARAIDEASARTVLALSPTLDYEQACGALPINGLISVAHRRGMRPELLDLRNSGDTAGDKFRVVGYASFVFNEQRS